MRVSKLFHVLVVTGAASVLSQACGGQSSDEDAEGGGSGGSGTGGGNASGGSATGGSEATGGADATGGMPGTGGDPASGGADNTGGEPPMTDCDAVCETAPNGWVLCEGSCCWLGAMHECC
jgi:hypothetical protein